MCSEKLVRYPEYRLLGERIAGCGYLKMQAGPEELSFEMKLRGLWDEPLLVKPVYVLNNGGERKIGTMVIENGKGVFTRIYRGEQVHGPEAVALLVWEKIRIPLDERREIVCDRGGTADIKPEEAALPENEHNIKPVQAVAKEEILSDEGQDAELKSTAEQDAKQTEKGEKDKKPDYEREMSEEQEEAKADKDRQSSELLQESIPVSKWEYLSKIYPHKRPFRDEREFLSVGPGDFAILSEKSYRMANNSFTLHGYYNFGHLLLARARRNNGFRYYVGVPGYYFDKEKQAAMLFGFESFEGVKDPAAQGDFGYYLLAVEL